MPDTLPASPIAAPDLTDRTLGDYRILRRVGVGGMGQVYLARQLSLKRDVALKLLRTDLAQNPTALKRFQAEAEAVARLNHPNIVHIHQLAEADGLWYMVLEYVEGRNLRDHLARKGPPDVPIALSIVRQVVFALQEAHKEGIVHRDIKPENVLVTRKVEVKVTDFGLSRFFAGATPPTNLTQSGLTLGTPLYMSPEQVQGQAVDLRTDIYSLGVTCYHLLAGEPPFRGMTAYDVALKHVQEHPRPLAGLCPDLPPDLCRLVHKMMAKNPADRYQSGREVLRDLTKVGTGVALSLGSASPAAGTRPHAVSRTAVDVPVPPPAAPTPRRRTPWGRWAVAALACVAAAAGGAVVSAGRTPPPGPPEPAPPPAAPVGLADIRPANTLVTTRERELLAVLANRDTKPDDVLRAHVELGLLYAKDRRLDEAADRFRKLENEQLPGAPHLARSVQTAGRLGRAVTLALRDTTEAAEESNGLVLGVLDVGVPRPPGKGVKADKADRYEAGYQQVVGLLTRHPALAPALAEALNRNALTLGKATLDPPALDRLRTPPRGKG